MDSFVSVQGLKKAYRKHRTEVPVLKGVDLDVEKNEFLSIVGHSGSGKSTLLHVLGTLDAPDEGRIYFSGKRLDNLNTRERDRIRNSQIGFVFQFYHLLPELTLLENVAMPYLIKLGPIAWFRRKKEIRLAAQKWIDRVGLSHRLTHKPRELSGGEMQRAAIARAILHQPQLLLADEPTGNLDAETGQEVLKILRELNQDGLTIIMVTHNMEIARSCGRMLQMKHGALIPSEPQLLRATA